MTGVYVIVQNSCHIVILSPGRQNQAVVVKTSPGEQCSGHMSSTATEAEIEKTVFKFLESYTHKLSATVSFCLVVAAGSPKSG